MTDFPAHPAWDFVVQLYSAPGVAPACLELQERHGIDVTLMLFCLWLGEDLRSMPPSLMATARQWRVSAVEPIRAARRWLKEKDAGLYQTALKAEIDCEHGELLALAQLASPGPARAPSPAAAAQALAEFFAGAKVVVGEADRAALLVLLSALGAENEIARALRAP